MQGFIKSKLVLTLTTAIMLASAIALPLAGSILHARPTHAQAPTWTATGNILLNRDNFPATTLPNGKVLIEGGFAPGSYTTDSELFDPATGVWTQTGSLNQGRGEHSAILLQDGRVLVAGGYAGPVLNSAELYDPATGIWTLTGSMSQVRTRYAATLLQNGMVLVAGGWDGSPIPGAEVYDPASGSWSSAGNMFISRADGAAVLLPSGKILVAGGDFANTNGITGESELYDPGTNSWSATGSMNVARGGFTTVLLPNGKVLAMGGGTPTGPTATAELYDPATGIWTLTGSMQHARNEGLGMRALMLADGTVLIIGGDTAGTSEVYDPSSGTWDTLTPMVTPQCGGATALLSDGRALIAGGSDCASNLTTVTELYTSTAPTPHNQLVIFLQGLNTDLTNGNKSSGTIVGMGFVPDTARRVLPHARFLEYSYSDSSPTGVPLPYGCLKTFSSPIQTDILTLNVQILRALSAEPANTETDIYLIGHSLGGAIALGFLDELQQGVGVLLPLTAHIKAVIALDSPLGGLDPGWINTFAIGATAIYSFPRSLGGCGPEVAIRHKTLDDLVNVFKSSSSTTSPDDTGPDPQGAQASLLVTSGSTLPTPIPSNEDLVEGGHFNEGFFHHRPVTSFLSIGNLNDFVYNPRECSDETAPSFLSTQFLEDEGDGSGLYGRNIAPLPDTCPNILNAVFHPFQFSNFINQVHREVLIDPDVQTGITTFLTPILSGAIGGTPLSVDLKTPLPINPYQPSEP